MNGYQCFYNNKVVEVRANTSYEAQKKAQAVLKLKDSQRYKITVMLCELNGEQYTHRAVD